MHLKKRSLISEISNCAGVWPDYKYNWEKGQPLDVLNSFLRKSSSIQTLSETQMWELITPLGVLVALWVGKYLPNQAFYPLLSVTLFVFGGLAFLTGLCALQLPETVGHLLPNSFDDVQKRKEETKQIFTWGWWAKDKQETQILLR